MRLLLFGGSFDPVHCGHLAMARYAQQHGQFDLVLFLPAARSPLKPNSPLASNDLRLRWLKLATADLPWAEVSEFELTQPPPSYTWQTVTWAEQQWPQAQLHWLLGADQWQNLHHWARIDWLDQHLRWVVCGRGDQPIQTVPGRHSLLLPDFHHPASSSALRQQLREHQPIPPGWLPAVLADEVRHCSAYTNPREQSPPPEGSSDR